LPIQQLNIGVPTKFFDGKKITVRYNKIVLDEFFDEKKADDYLRKLNKDKGYLDIEIKRVKNNRLVQMKNSFVDINGSGIFSPHELESFVDLEIIYKMKVRASQGNEAGDVIALSGILKGQSLDPFGLADRAINSWKSRFDLLWDEKRQFANSIDRHFKKIHSPEPRKPSLNKVVLDFRHMDSVGNNMKKKVIDYIYNDLIVGVGENESKFPAQYKQYVNDNYFIKLNF